MAGLLAQAYFELYLRTYSDCTSPNLKTEMNSETDAANWRNSCEEGTT